MIRMIAIAAWLGALLAMLFRDLSDEARGLYLIASLVAMLVILATGKEADRD